MEDNKEILTEQGQESSMEGAEKATYTEEQVMAMLQKETDRRVSMALAKQQAKFEKKIAEAEKLRGMNEEQKAQYEFEMKVKAFEEKEREFELMRNRVEAQNILGERGLPLAMVDYIVAEDADTMLERINSFEKMFKAAVNDAVSKRIAAPTPKASSATQTGMTKEKFKALSIAQQSEMFRTNPELVKQFL